MYVKYGDICIYSCNSLFWLHGFVFKLLWSKYEKDLIFSEYAALGIVSSGAAKESVSLIVNASGGVCFISGLLLFSIFL